MKYKVIASVVIVVVLLAVLALKGCANSQAVDENGNPAPTENVQQ